MRWKMFALMTALLLVVSTTASSNTVAAQEDLVKKVRTLVVAGMGAEQALELYLAPTPSPRRSGPVVEDIRITVEWEKSPFLVGTICRQTVTTTVKGNILNLQMEAGNDYLLVNGGKFRLDGCFKNANRAVYVVSARFPNGAEGPASDPNTFDSEFGIQHVRNLLGYAIVNLVDGSTAASEYHISCSDTFRDPTAP